MADEESTQIEVNDFKINRLSAALGVKKEDNRRQVEEWYAKLTERHKDELQEQFNGAEIQNLNFYFTDMLGQLQRTGTGFEEIDDRLFDKHFGFDGSSIRGFQEIDESDQLLRLDKDSAFLDLGTEDPAIGVMSSVYHPVPVPHAFDRDPRVIGDSAEDYLTKAAIGASTSYWGPELEFKVFSHVVRDVQPNTSFYALDHEEGFWNIGKSDGKPNLGYQVRPKRGYFPPAHDRLYNFRAAFKKALVRNARIRVENFHHEVGQCQNEVDMRFDSLVKMGDKVQIYKHIARQVAMRYKLTPTFMPKPLFGDNGSGMHVHQSLWKGNGENREPLFFDGSRENRHCLSKMAEHYIAGLFKHAPALMAFTNPTVNSFKRLDPGYEAPVFLVWSARNRSAAARIPVYDYKTPAALRVEWRIPDPLANPYIAFAAMLMAGIDGVQNEMPLGDPCDEDVYKTTRTLNKLPSTLDEALNALEKDNEFLRKGGVFPEKFIQDYVDYKRKEIVRVNQPITPAEMLEYFDY